MNEQQLRFRQPRGAWGRAQRAPSDLPAKRSVSTRILEFGCHWLRQCDSGASGKRNLRSWQAAACIWSSIWKIGATAGSKIFAGKYTGRASGTQRAPRELPVKRGTSSALRLLLALAVCIAGCGTRPAHDTPVNPAASGAEPRKPSADEGGSAIELTPVDRAAYDATIAKYRGKVVLVDFWATWCLPCVEQLPHTLEMASRLSDRGLAVVTVSCDEPGDTAQVATLLGAKNAGSATNLISQFGGSTQTMEAFEITSGAVPFYKLYDRNGKLRQTFGINPAAKKQFTAADIEAHVEKLLTE